jgi:hypothetical protein
VTADELAAGVERLLHQVGHWETGRWDTAVRGGDGSRADQVRALVQQLADLGAEAEGNPHREVPHAGAMTLPDQIRVLTDDLLTADPTEAVLSRAVEAVTEARKAL